MTEPPAEPIVAARHPARADLQPGTHWWCACGRSQNQPFCDGSHKGTGLAPLRIDVTEPKVCVLCQCKRTGTPPLCDGTHKAL